MDGVWGSYTMAEVLSFVIFVIMVMTKMRQLKKEGIEADVFLLDQNVEKNTVCFTCNCEKETFADYQNQVINQLKEDSADDVMVLDAERYLDGLGKCDVQSAGKYIEVEVNRADHRVFIRDNLDHSRLEEYIEDFDACKSRAEYGPVLGWNRICMEYGKGV